MTRRFDIQITFLYLLFGGLWILLSDHLLASRITDTAVLTSIQTYKGGTFVVSSALVLFFLSRQYLRINQKIERQLRESEERYRLLFENSKDAVLLTTPQGTILSANMAACQLFGYTEDEIKHIGRADMVDTTDPRLHAALEERSRKGAFSGEITFVRHDKSKFLGEVSSRIFTDRHGTAQTTMIIRDITERARLAESLRQSEERFRNVIETSPDGTFIIDQQTGKILFANSTASLLYGYSNEEFLNLNVRDISGEIDKTLSAIQAQTIRVPRRIHRHKDGTHFPVEIIGSYFTQNGRQLHTAFIRDITERQQAEESLRKSEQFFRFIATNSPDVIFLQDCDLRYQWLINSISDRPTEQVIGKTDLELFPPAQAIPLTALKKQILQTGEGHRIEIQLDVDGVLRWHDAIYQPTRDQAGQVNGIAAYVRDITERKRIEQERENLLHTVEQGREQLQTLSRRLIEIQESERRTLARELHDEVGQVLSAVKTNLQTVQLSPDPDTLDMQLDESVNIVNRTLEQIRMLALNLRPSILDDFGLAATLEWYLQHQGKRMRLKIDFQNDLGEERFAPEIETTGFRFVQTALTNVERHAHATQVQVIARLVKLDDKATSLELIVRDNGIGFDVPGALVRARHGASFGLLGIQERVQLVGGAVTIESAPAHGCEIRALVPITK
jgi:PAS domain S-box-containing protein